MHIRGPRKGVKGAAATYISRKQSLKKLQLSLKDFRRLCILKGIYPVEPRHKKKANKNNSTNKTYYYLKDIQFLDHEPLIHNFRNFRVFVKRLKKAIGKKDQDASVRLRKNQPTFKLDHIVKERYPTFIDAVRDLDDVLSMCFLFNTFPKNRNVRPELIHLCRRLTGIYYQAEILGQPVTWMVPHALGYSKPNHVDFKIMVTFAQFYSTMLGFVNYKLYHSVNLVYPPKLSVVGASNEEFAAEDFTEYVAALNLSLKSTLDNCAEEEVQIDTFPEGCDEDEMREQKLNEEKIKKLKELFSKCKIYLNREVPKESLVFIIRCFGGEVSFDKTLFVGATFEESDESITHQIVDRPTMKKQYLNRYYVQPQWIYDSVNARMLLPVESYFPGEALPPHLSPFVEEKEGDYIPPEKKALLDMQNGVIKGARRTEESSDDELLDSDDEISDTEDEDEDVGNEDSPAVDPPKSQDSNSKKRKLEDNIGGSKSTKTKVTAGTPLREDAAKLAQKEAAEEKRLALMMMPKKRKHLYNKIIHGQKRKNREVRVLEEKRKAYEKKQKTAKKGKNK